MRELVCLEKINAIEIFTGEGLDELLRSIEREAGEFEPEISTAAGRKEIASMAYKVSQSKTFLETAGKRLVSDWKQKAKQVDFARKKSRDFLDDLRNRVRRPLTDWEFAEEAKATAEKLAAKIAEDEILAHQENDLIDRQRTIEAKEAEIVRQEAERKEKDLAEEKERAQILREKQIYEKAIEAEKRASEEKIRAERETAERQIWEEKERANRAERDQIAAEERAKIEKVAAVRAAKDEAARIEQMKERTKKREEAAEKALTDKAAQDINHRRDINKIIVQDLIAGGFTEKQAKLFVVLIANGGVRNIVIGY